MKEEETCAGNSSYPSLLNLAAVLPPSLRPVQTGTSPPAAQLKGDPERSTSCPKGENMTASSVVLVVLIPQFSGHLDRVGSMSSASETRLDSGRFLRLQSEDLRGQEG